MENFKNKEMSENPSQKTKKQVYNVFRENGYTQKDSGFFAGVAEKTAGLFEKERIQSIKDKIKEYNDLIERLKKRADNPNIRAKELIELTTKIEDLLVKRERLHYSI